MTEPLWVGDIFAGKYKVETVLGQGGMGVVLGARHLGLDEPVAIKVLQPAVMDIPGMVERFVREARASTKIKSEHVVRVTDVDTLPSGVPYMVMERLEGADLATICKRGPLDVEQSVRWVLQACEAISEAHALGIIHRDLKPANLFLARRRDGSSIVKVLDFGVSKVSGTTGEANLTTAGTALGSPNYMSPEQMISAKDVDPRTDLWALGAVLYRLVTGEPAFRGDTLPELCTRVLKAAPRHPVELRPDLPPALATTILRCLEKDPALRFASVADSASALLPFAGAGATWPARSGRSAHDMVVIAPPSAVPGPILSESIAGTVTPPHVRARRGRLWSAAVVALLLLVAAGLASILLRSRHAERGVTAASSSTADASLAAATPAPVVLEPPPPVMSASAAPTSHAAESSAKAVRPSPAAPAAPLVRDPFEGSRQ